MNTSVVRSIAALATALPLLAACGGGTGGGASQTPTPPAAGALAAGDIGCGEADFRDRTLAAINQRRAAGAQCGANGNFPGAAAVGWSDALASAAFGHSRDMAERGYFAHESPEGTTVSMRILAAGYAWSSIGENVARGSLSADTVVDLWMASPDHCKNIMTARFVHAGMACAQSAGSQRHYTLDFAAPR